jgi:hypothetical protein
MLTTIGAAQDRSIEVIQAILEPWTILPPVPPAAISLLGPSPNFNNGNSNAQAHTGDDCGVGGGEFAPIVGVIGNAAAGQVRADMNRPDRFQSGPYTEEDTVADITDPTDPIVVDAGHGTIDPSWTDCDTLKELIVGLAIQADYYCNTDVSSCSWPSTVAPNDIIFIDGDLSNTPSGSYTGILVVTGQLTYSGNTGWDGIILAVGEGAIIRSGGGAHNPSGSVIVANVDPTPNGPNNDRSDWCTAPPDGFGSVNYEVTGAGNSTVEWCTADIDTSNARDSFRVAEFLQR